MTELPQSCRANDGDTVQRKRRNKRVTKPQLLTRAQLDGRTNAAKAFDAIATAIANDLGGETALSEIQRHLVEGFAGVAVTVADMNARRALGEPVDLTKQAVAVSTMVRLATRLGVHRIARDISPPSLEAYLESKRRRAAEQAGGSP